MVIGYQFFNTGIAKVILKPTEKFPEGKNYFYIDADDIHLIMQKKDITLYGDWDKCAYPGGSDTYRVIAEKHYGFNSSCFIDHINGVGIDNTSRNLRPVSPTDNGRNRILRGYSVSGKEKFTFREPELVPYNYYGRTRYRKVTHRSLLYEREDLVAYHRKVWEDKWWEIGYDFLLDRRGDLDIIELEYSGQISHEEATFRHVMRKAKNNAWYVLRYHLYGYFDKYGIDIPEYDLNEERRMVDVKTGNILCPLG